MLPFLLFAGAAWRCGVATLGASGQAADNFLLRQRCQAARRSEGLCAVGGARSCAFYLAATSACLWAAVAFEAFTLRQYHWCFLRHRIITWRLIILRRVAATPVALAVSTSAGLFRRRGLVQDGGRDGASAFLLLYYTHNCFNGENRTAIALGSWRATFGGSTARAAFHAWRLSSAFYLLSARVRTAGDAWRRVAAFFMLFLACCGHPLPAWQQTRVDIRSTAQRDIITRSCKHLPQRMIACLPYHSSSSPSLPLVFSFRNYLLAPLLPRSIAAAEATPRPLTPTLQRASPGDWNRAGGDGFSGAHRRQL
jgi:hypothetical protein